KTDAGREQRHNAQEEHSGFVVLGVLVDGRGLELGIHGVLNCSRSGQYTIDLARKATIKKIATRHDRSRAEIVDDVYAELFAHLDGVPGLEVHCDPDIFWK